MAIGPAAIDTQDQFISIKRDNDILSESIARILLTEPNERLNNPTFGSTLRRYLFNLDNGLFEEDIKSEIYDAITKWESRVKIIDIVIKETNDNHKIAVEVYLRNIISEEEFTVQINEDGLV